MKRDRPRIVAVTDGNLLGRRAAVTLERLGIPVEILSISHAIPRRRGRTWPAYLRTAGRAWMASLGPLRVLKHRRMPPYPRRPIYGGRCNSPRMLAALAALRPDWVLMVGGGILSAAAIATARDGILNAHPALLPWVRGVDVLRHAVLQGIPLGVTGHFIDAGIDTGDVVCRFLLPVQEGEGFATLAQRADVLAAAVLVDMARRVHAGEMLPRAPSPERLPLCQTLDADGARRAEQCLRAGAATRAYRLPPPDPAIQDGQALLEQYQGWWGGRPPF